MQRTELIANLPRQLLRYQPRAVCMSKLLRTLAVVLSCSLLSVVLCLVLVYEVLPVLHSVNGLGTTSYILHTTIFAREDLCLVVLVGSSNEPD